MSTTQSPRLAGGTFMPHTPVSPSPRRCLYLVGVCTEVKVFYEARCKFTEEEVVGLIDGPQAPVRVVVGTGAGTEGPHCGRENACSECARRKTSLSDSLPETGSRMPSDRHRFLRHLQEYGPLKPDKGRWPCAGLPSPACPCLPIHRPPMPCLPIGSHVQSGAVCQWWLSWVKHVRPGMLHVSLFCSRLSSLRSFFLRFCSRSSHTLSFSCRPFLRVQRTT